MTTKTYKVLGQSAPAAGTDTILYTVPALTSAVCSSLTIVNRNTSGVTGALRIAVVPSGQTLGTQHYLEYDRLLETRGSLKLVLGFTLAAGDRVYVRADTAEFSFSLFGGQITA